MRFTLVLLIFATSLLAYTKPSKQPPTGIPLEKCPLFVSIGFDDNGYADAMTWLQEYLAEKKNPEGNGNPATFDGSPARVTFYVNAKYGDPEYNTKGAEVIEAWKKLYADGHEIGNHTYTHGYMAGMTAEDQAKEIQSCSDFLVEKVGIPREKITGFRAPYLNYNNETITKMVASGISYDCSIEHSLEGDGTNFYWPYQLDGGSVSPIVSVNVKAFPGTWEVPMNEVIIPQGHTGGQWHGLTGLDYNMWVSRKMSKEAFLATLKYTLDQRLKGNRAPFTYGAHSDYYSVDKVWDNWAKPDVSLADMRDVFEQFIDYALSKPEVRLVPVQSILDWMENPVALGSEVSVAQNSLAKKLKTRLIKKAKGFSLELPQEGTYTLSLLNYQGRVIAHQTVESISQSAISLDETFSPAAQGLYLLTIEHANFKETIRIVR